MAKKKKAEPTAYEIEYLSYKPARIPEKAWGILINAWENGLSDREAAFRMSKDDGFYITEKEIRNILDGNPKLADLKEFIKSDLVSRAKLNLAESIRGGSISTTKWYLERKAPDEFSSKAAVALEGAIVQVSMEEKQAEMNKFLEKFGISDEKEEKEPIHFLEETKEGK